MAPYFSVLLDDGQLAGGGRVEEGEDEGEGEGQRTRAPVLKPRHPWLRWIQHALAGEAVERVVMLGEAHLFAGRAALGLGYRIEGETGVELVRSDELNLFLTQIGACDIDLYSARRGWSDLAMRLVADDLSWTLPGTITAHDARGDGPRGVGRLLSELGRKRDKSVRPAATCYACEPQPVPWKERDGDEARMLETFTLARPSLREWIESGPTFGWLGAVQRQLERQVAALLRDDIMYPELSSEAYQARRRGIEDGLLSMVNAVESHLRGGDRDEGFREGGPDRDLDGGDRDEGLQDRTRDLDFEDDNRKQRFREQNRGQDYGEGDSGRGFMERGDPT
jgi:hypothetical protein